MIEVRNIVRILLGDVHRPADQALDGVSFRLHLDQLLRSVDHLAGDLPGLRHSFLEDLRSRALAAADVLRERLDLRRDVRCLRLGAIVLRDLTGHASGILCPDLVLLSLRCPAGLPLPLVRPFRLLFQVLLQVLYPLLQAAVYFLLEACRLLTGGLDGGTAGGPNVRAAGRRCIVGVLELVGIEDPVLQILRPRAGPRDDPVVPSLFQRVVIDHQRLDQFMITVRKQLIQLLSGVGLRPFHGLRAVFDQHSLLGICQVV